MATTPLMYKTFYDVSRFTLWADNPADEDAKRASFKLSFRDGNPRFVVNTGGSGQESMINFPMDVATMVSILCKLEDIAKGPNGDQFTVDSQSPVYRDDKPTKEQQVIAVLHMGKTAAGIIYLSVTAGNKPKIVFPVKASKFHTYRDQSKNIVADDVISKYITLGLVDILKTAAGAAMMQYSNEDYEHGERRPTSIVKPGTKAPVRGAVGQTKGTAMTDFKDLDEISF
jgi:hypothetical protein